MQKEGYVLLVGSLLVMKSSVLVVFLLSYKIQNKRLNRKIPNLEKLLLEKNLIRKKNKNDFGRFEKNLIRKTLVSVGYSKPATLTTFATLFLIRYVLFEDFS